MTDTDKARNGFGAWFADLAIGFRFAVAGGRPGWIRAGLTALGVGLGVAMLLAAASIPNVIAAADQRSADLQWVEAPQKSDGTVLMSQYRTTFRDQTDIEGQLLQAEGSRPTVPAGIDELPEPGEMYVSPALAELLDSPEGELLEPRLDYDTAGVIADEGLQGPGDFRYYAGSDALNLDKATRVESFGAAKPPPEELPAVMVLLVLVAITIMLLPVVMFVAVAVRFGGERRDRRLAALRLVGADANMTRRMAAGESLLGALCGLLLGVVVFEAGVRLLVELRFIETVTSGNVSVFAYDFDPVVLFAALIMVAVPLVAIFTTQLAMRHLVIEPLGVVRGSKPRRRRLWWRLVLVVLGVAALVPIITTDSFSGYGVESALVVTGVLTLLLGMSAILPWLVEVVVARVRGGAVSFHMATRRLQLGGGTASRAIIGVAVAAAGAIALHMLFVSIENDRVEYTGDKPNQGELIGSGADTDVKAVADGVDDIAGVKTVRNYSTVHVTADNMGYSIVVADCETLSRLSTVSDCGNGDVFSVAEADPVLPTGQDVDVQSQSVTSQEPAAQWAVPEPADSVSMSDPNSSLKWTSLLATPGAMPDKVGATASHTIVYEYDRSRPDSIEHLRNYAAQHTPMWYEFSYNPASVSSTFANLRYALYVGVVATMLLIGLSLLVNTVEQLQERRRLTAVLVAFGTRRRSLLLSVLWQTAIPVVCGLVVATVTGLGLGAMLIRMTSNPLQFDWQSVATINGAGAAMVVVVTLLSFPLLWRMMRPDGIRTE